MEQNEIIDQLAIRLYDKLKDQRKITPILVQRHAQVTPEMSLLICVKIWRMIREDAMKWATEVVMR
jgi:hypothetical protein